MKSVKILKRRLAAFVAFTLIVTMVLPYAGNIGVHLVSTDAVYAADPIRDTELLDESDTLDQDSDNNSSNTTLFKWAKMNRYYGSGNRFNGKQGLSFRIKSSDNMKFNDGDEAKNQLFYEDTDLGLNGLLFEAVAKDTADGVGENDTALSGHELGNIANGNVNIVNNVDDNYKNVEVKAVTSVSPDKKYVLLDLYAYNQSDETQYLSIRMLGDTMITGNDGARAIVNKQDQLIHCVDDNSCETDGAGKITQINSSYASFDVISTSDDLHLDSVNVAVACSFSHGNSINLNGYSWKEYYQESNISDSYISIGWRNLEIRGYETIHKRIAFLTRAKTYYVNSQGSDQTDYAGDTKGLPGAYDNPFKTVSYALDQVKSGEKAYICLQSENLEIPSFNVTSNKDITIQTADIDMAGHKIRDKYVAKVPTPSQLIVRYNSVLTVQDIIFDGLSSARSKPFIKQIDGKLNISSGTTFKNFKNTNADDGAAVIDVTGTDSKFGVYGAEIVNCISKDKVTGSGATLATKSNCAINYAGGNTNFEINGVNKIYNNFNTDGKKANVYLADGRVMQVTHLLRNEIDNTKISRVGVKTEKLPNAFIGNVENANQEVIVAKPTSSYPEIDGISNCPFEQYFEADAGTTENRMSIKEGRFAGNEKNAVLSRPGNTISYEFKKANGFPMDGMEKDSETYPAGERLTMGTPSNVTAGYSLKEVKVSGNGFTADNNKNSPTFGVVTGVMGLNNVTITYVYEPKEVAFKYVPNGALQTNVTDNKGYVGENIQGFLPVLTKYAYTFKGWFTNSTNPIGWTDFTTGLVANLKDSYPTYPNNDVTLYAKWAPDANVNVPISEKHTNAGGTFTFYEGNLQQHHVEEELNTFDGFESKAVPGYKANKTKSNIDPNRFLYRTEEIEVGTFSEVGGTVKLSSGYMPAAQTTVNFKYEVDESVKKKVKVKFYKKNGTVETPLDIGGVTEVEAGEYFAEKEFTYDAPSKTGYAIVDASIESGNNGNGKVNTSSYLTPVTGKFESVNNYRFVGKMPNQEVVLKYVYELSGGSNAFIVDHADKTVKDTSYTILRSNTEAKVYEDSLTASKVDMYGYTYSTHRVDPNIGSFDAQDNYTGSMPLSESVTVTYEYTRNTNYFKDITFKKSQLTGCDNTLQSSGSPDMTEVTANAEYKVQTLITTNDGTGWKFSTLRDRNLIPAINIVDAARYESVGETGYFIDTNNNGLFDNGEVDLTWDYEFTGPVTLVPHLQRIIRYITITLTTNGNGKLIGTSGTIKNTYSDENTWADVTKPTAEGYYYDFLGWYLDDIEVQNTDLLVPDGVYVAKFVKNTGMQDQVKKVLTSVKISDDGYGVMTLRDLHPGYIYLVTDNDGNVKLYRKNDNSQTMDIGYSDGIHMNQKYKLYEISGVDVNDLNGVDTIAAVNGVVTAANGEISDESNCYVPAVIKNYKVTIDQAELTSGNKNVASLTIVPAAANYEYALYKNGSIAPGTDWVAGDATGITFYALEPGTTYNVVTKNAGVETTDQGTVIYIDSISELTEDSYAVTVINGTVNGENSILAKAGERVNIETNDSQFVRWQALNGNISFANANSKQTSFAMPNRNVVIVAKEADSSNNLKISSANYGSDDTKVYLDISKEPSLISQLATDVEKYLSEHNFKIGYKISYTNDILTFEEEEAVKNALGSDAARGALAIDVNIDRYLDSQRVDVFNEILPIPTTGGTMTHALVEELHGLYGDSILNKVDGLNEYIEGLVETTEETTIEEETEKDETTTTEETTKVEPTVSDDTSSETTIEEEAEEDETTTETTKVEPTVSDDTSSETTTNDEAEDNETTTINETEAEEEETAASEESTTIEKTKKDETTSEEETSEKEQTGDKEDEGEKDPTIAGFGTGTELVNNSTDLSEMLENLILFGSSFPGRDLRVNTYVLLSETDSNNGDYKVYKVDGAANLTEVPLLVTNDTIKEKGIIAFTAEMDARYIIAYNKYNVATFINENPGSTEEIGLPKKLTVKVKYGETIANYTTEVPANLPDYEYEKASFTEGVWTYKNKNREAGNLFDPVNDEVIAPITVYAFYNTDIDTVQILLNRIKSALDRAKPILENYFLLTNENTSISGLCNKLKAFLEGNTVTVEEAERFVNELIAILDEVEPKLDTREKNYNEQNEKNIPASATRRASTGGSGGSGGGGGGGGGSVSGKTAGGPGAVNPIEAELASSMPAVTAMPIVPAIQNLVPQVGVGAVASANGSVLVVVNSDVSVFIKTDGTLSRDEWVFTNNGWYHTNPHGGVDTGWRMLGPKWYHFEDSNVASKGKMTTGWVTGSKNTYYTSPEGEMVVGYQIINGKTYYFNANRNDPNLPMGAMLTNIKTPDGRFAGPNGEVR